MATHKHCQACGQLQHGKGHHDLPLRTVFGKITLASPRIAALRLPAARDQELQSFGELLPERTTPEMLFLETKWSSLMSYGLTADLLQEVLPTDSPLYASTIREHVCSVAERMESELGDEQGLLH